MTHQRSEAATGTPPTVDPAVMASPTGFPADLTAWCGHEALFRMVQASAARACGDSWVNLVEDRTASRQGDDVLTLVSYCYLQGIYHSIDVIRRLDTDALLAPIGARIGVRPEQIRRFRREHRRALTDCLTHSLVGLWRLQTRGSDLAQGPVTLPSHRLYFSFLEPFYLQAQDRIDRAVVLDSMALDY
ncbi:MAG: hypothetical protein JNK85_21630 [Verrucomicrobiales bacterium]|nr:hypothetical protein [Verrucomicrobiales bacterium]